MFGVLALRASGLGFLMITLALGQIVWGVAYRWNDVTGGDNGIRYPSRPSPFLSLLGATGENRAVIYQGIVRPQLDLQAQVSLQNRQLGQVTSITASSLCIELSE